MVAKCSGTTSYSRASIYSRRSKHIPEAANVVESVLRTELLEIIPKPLEEACMRHGCCTAELIVWYSMKQLILPPDVNEQKEILTPPSPSSHP